MANKCECGKRIPRGGTHCVKCVRMGGGYKSNMAAELRAVAQENARQAAAKARKDAVAAHNARIADRKAKAKAADQKRQRETREHERAAAEAARKMTKARGRVEDPAKKKGWW